MNYLDALIAEAEASVISSRNDLLAAGEDENELAELAADLANEHEPTDEEREAFGRIYSLMKATPDCPNKDEPTGAKREASGHISSLVTATPNATDADIPFEVVVPKIATQWEMMHPAPLDDIPFESIASEAAIPWAKVFQSYHFASCDRKLWTARLDFSDWDWDPRRKALSFRCRKGDNSWWTHLMSSKVCAFMPVATTGKQLSFRLEHELLIAADEVMTQLHQELVTHLAAHRKQLMIAASTHGAVDSYRYMCSAVEASLKSRSDWDAMSHVNPARLQQAVIAACGPPDVKVQERVAAKQATD